ncbi:MAG TPA: energy transducer TonB [Candidatus Dormibacteraeota bacterium]|nr:energy transducer TonB [Candidatus Dormibacteraeota bacterium]
MAEVMATGKALKRAAFALAAAAWLMASAGMPAWARNPSNSAAAALVTKGLDASNIEAKGAPAFRLEARIRVEPGGGQPEEGKLVLIRTPAGWWHQEITLPGYHNIEISSEMKLWTKSTANYLPFPVFLTGRAVNIWNWLRHAGGQQLSGPQTSAATGEACVTATISADVLRYCFDLLSGNLTRVVDSRWNMAFRYSEYAPFGTKSFPRLMEVGRRGENPFIEIRVVQLAEEEKPDLRLFLPVKGAKQTPSEAACDKVEAAQVEKMVPPGYPPEAQRAGISGIVKLYAEVGTDGIARGMWPVNSPTPVLTYAAINAIRRWRYRPRTCQSTGTKLPQIQLITIVFSSP